MSSIRIEGKRGPTFFHTADVNPGDSSPRQHARRQPKNRQHRKAEAPLEDDPWIILSELATVAPAGFIRPQEEIFPFGEGGYATSYTDTKGITYIAPVARRPDLPSIDIYRHGEVVGSIGGGTSKKA